MALYERDILFESLSILTILKLIFCPSDKILLGFIFLFVQSSSELWIKPSTPFSILTKQPYSTILVTVPEYISPILYFLSMFSYGSSVNAFIDAETLFVFSSILIIFTLSF